MSRTQTAHLAVAADYADALMTARRAKNLLFLLLLLILLSQLALFFVVRYSSVIKFETKATIAATVTPPTPTLPTPATVPSSADLTEAGQAAATQPTAPVTTSTAAAPISTKTTTVSTADLLQYLIPALNFLGILLSVVFSIVLLLLTTIMLVGRLVGVSHVTGAFIWSVLLALMLFPWQAFLISGENYPVRDNSISNMSASATMDDAPPQPAFKVPGVLYTYPELRQGYNFSNQPIAPAVLKWGRFVGFPVLALLILLLLQGKSSRGLKLALGETEIHVEVSNRNEPLL